MPRVFIYVPAIDRYIGIVKFGHAAEFAKKDAELFKEDEINHVARSVLGATPQYQIQEPTFSELQAWYGRRGGKKKSPEKARAVRRNGMLGGPKTHSKNL